MTTGCVIIGRNEAARLPAALGSAQTAALPTIYVDSGSHDASISIAQNAGVAVVALDPSRPFTAARARNEGLDALCDHYPDIMFVIFLDGDCRLDAGFERTALATMTANPDCAIVVGHLAEEQDDPSAYTRLSALEWSSATGEMSDFGNLGGIMLARIADVRAVGGFNAAMIAGEDSELGVRLSLAGKRVIKIDAPMAMHRADIVRFGQWWQRSVRAGQALTHRYRLHGQSRLHDCKRAYWSTLIWGGIVPVTAFGLALFTSGLSLLMLAAYGALMARMVSHYRRSGAPFGIACSASLFGIAAKFANFVGLVRFYRHQARGKIALVEYK